jgi:IS5 family transposase
MGKAKRKRASAPIYVSPNHLTLEGFQTPFDQQLAKDNRWVVLANLIPWDEVCAIYLKHIGVSNTGRPAISPRVVIGSLIIKHLGNFDDRETVEQIREKMYMHYFFGYSSFTMAQPFDPTLFVEFRKRLGVDNLNEINDKIIALKTNLEVSKANSKPSDPD